MFWSNLGHPKTGHVPGRAANIVWHALLLLLLLPALHGMHALLREALAHHI
jgi:hypothetical protein